MSKRAHVRIDAFALVAVLIGIGIVTACNGSDDGAGDDASACPASCSAVPSCASVTTGVYGTTSSSCTQHGVACPGNPGSACTSLEVTAYPRVNDGGLALVDGGPAFSYIGSSAVSVRGVYAIPLDPGEYLVCCADQPFSNDCAQVEVAAGNVVRANAGVTTSLGGRHCGVSAD